MSLRVKFAIGVVLLFVVAGVALYVGSGWVRRPLRSKTGVKGGSRESRELNGQVTSLNGYWANKEEEYKGRIAR